MAAETGRDDLGVGDRPHAMHYAQVVGGLEWRLPDDGLFQDILRLALRVGIEPENLAQVGLRGTEEHQTVGLGRGVRLFVRKDLALAKARQTVPAHEPATGVLHAVESELLVIDVNRRVGFGKQHALGLPVLQETGSTGIAIILWRVTRLLAVKDQPHRVAGVLFIKLFLQLGRNHVVGGGDHVAQRTNVA